VTGYKTNTGAVLVAIGGVLVSMAEGCPISDLIYWIQMAGSLMVAIGGALAVYGIGDKIDRGNVAAMEDRKAIADDAAPQLQAASLHRGGG
jgi:hypothetical protein